ncbi:MAG: 16S rRNA (cytidine(1402)-2'-O)-methyltransferase [candidate division WOR-3 bacterium]|jgi:16S rRNA (cytidine1402-2'-O)-methyltransferase
MGKLFIIATPIGNLKDITIRAIETLKFVDIILCEDTRRAKILLDYYDIKNKKLLSYFEGNEQRRVKEVLKLLEEGKNIGLISDAGTPLISDPGYRLVRTCRENNIEVIPIPGPSAVISALSVSGLETDKFLFLGFLPKKKSKRINELLKYKNFEGSIVIYVSVYKIKEFLEEILEVFGNRKVFIAREMTKAFEEYIYGNLSEVKDKIKEKGEFVVVISKEF